MMEREDRQAAWVAAILVLGLIAVVGYNLIRYGAILPPSSSERLGEPTRTA
jgi:hypothetical protein